MRSSKSRSPLVPAAVSLVLLGVAVGATLWFVQFRARSGAESLSEQITRLYSSKMPPTCEQLGTMLLELADSPHAAEMLAGLDREQAGIAYDASRNVVYFIHVREDSRACVGRAYKSSGLGRANNHAGFPDFLAFQKIDVGPRDVSLQFGVAKDEKQRAAIERYGLEPGVAYVTTFDGPSDAFDLAGLARRARRR